MPALGRWSSQDRVRRGTGKDFSVSIAHRPTLLRVPADRSGGLFHLIFAPFVVLCDPSSHLVSSLKNGPEVLGQLL